MALAIGTRIGIYEVLGPLGAGGMGEVYRARDTRLGRDVALKILPPAFTADADRVARFTREARLLASLNHPHIGAIYGFEDSPSTGSWQASVPALVLELVDGETLDERVGRGPLPLREVLLIAQQIADALDAAHVAGVVHRDLKPANVMITPEGGLKVLDFGLAKAVDADGSSAEVANAPTGTSDGTRAGVVLGTVAFMSPEQARGKPVDKRTDIWAFGCVLYRLLTGRPAFGGETLSDTIVAILEREPDWTVLPRQTPPGVRGLLRHCLEKDPRRRLRDIGDARRWLDDDAAGPASVSTDATPRRHGVAWLLGGVSLVLASLTGWLLWTGPSAVPPPNVQFSRLTDLVGMEDTPAVSPDGKFLAFVFPVDGRRQIWLRQLAGGGAFQRTHDDAHHDHPRWLPDSSAIVYFTPSSKEGEPGTLMEISVQRAQLNRYDALSYPGGGMRRRNFIVAIGGAAAMPFVAGAQQTIPLVGVISLLSPETMRQPITAFLVGLREVGYHEGQNVAVEYRFAEGQYERIPAFVADLVRRRAAMLVGATQVAQVAKRETATVPIVFNTGGDPVRLGLVASFNRPGGNLTGVVQFTQGLEAKRLGLLHEIAPKVDLIAALVDPNFVSAEAQVRDVQEAAGRLGMQHVILRAGTENEIDAAFVTLVQRRAGALLVCSAPFFYNKHQQLVRLAARHAVPAIYERRDFAAAGGLMSYGTNLSDAYRQMGVYAGRILGGERPADLPVVQLTKFEFVINLKTVKALGLALPPMLLARADEVIE